MQHSRNILVPRVMTFSRTLLSPVRWYTTFPTRHVSYGLKHWPVSLYIEVSLFLLSTRHSTQSCKNAHNHSHLYEHLNLLHLPLNLTVITKYLKSKNQVNKSWSCFPIHRPNTDKEYLRRPQWSNKDISRERYLPILCDTGASVLLPSSISTASTASPGNAADWTTAAAENGPAGAAEVDITAEAAAAPSLAPVAATEERFFACRACPGKELMMARNMTMSW